MTKLNRTAIEAGNIRVFFNGADVTPMVMEADDTAGTTTLWLRTILFPRRTAVLSDQEGRVQFIHSPQIAPLTP